MSERIDHVGSLLEIEHEVPERTTDACGGNAVAPKLGIDRPTIYRRPRRGRA